MNFDFGPATDCNNSNMYVYNADFNFLNGQGLSIDNMDTNNMDLELGPDKNEKYDCCWKQFKTCP